MRHNYEYLTQLFGGYFHQDWDIEGETDEDIVAAFACGMSFDQRAATITELDDLIQFCAHDELEAERSLAQFGSEYHYQADNLNAVDWLKRLRVLLSDFVAN